MQAASLIIASPTSRGGGPPAENANNLVRIMAGLLDDMLIRVLPPNVMVLPFRIPDTGALAIPADQTSICGNDFRASELLPVP